MHRDFVQYIVVRKDLVELMGYGKLSAQVAHASLGAVFGREEYEKVLKGEIEFLKNPNLYGWLKGSFAKIVCYINTKTKLINLAEKLEKDGIKCKLIYDSCLTKIQPEENNGTTLTCMGTYPIKKENTPKYMKKLQLL